MQQPPPDSPLIKWLRENGKLPQPKLPDAASAVEKAEEIIREHQKR